MLTAKKEKKKKNGISASIRIGREIQCLPYAGFFVFVFVFETLLKPLPEKSSDNEPLRDSGLIDLNKDGQMPCTAPKECIYVLITMNSTTGSQ